MYENLIKILLVEDDEDDYLLTRNLVAELEPGKYELTWAADYEQALAEIKTGEFDVCLLDYRLGEYNGVELLRETNARGYKLPAILLAAQDDQDTELKAMRAGAADYLIKGQFNKALLERCIRYTVERAKTLEALRASETKYRQIVETAIEGVLAVDREAKITYCNRRMAQMLGDSVNNLLACSVFDFIDENARARAERNFERRKQGVTEQLEFRFTRRDGAVLWTLISTTPMCGADGKFDGALAMVTDITERKRAEEQLHHQLNFTEAITASLGEGVYALDAGGRLTFINPAGEAALGWTQAELLGRKIHSIIHFQSADGTPIKAAECPLLGVLRSGRTVQVESDAFTHKDGSLLPVSYTSSPIITDGQIVGAVLAFHVITERKRAEEALRESKARVTNILESITDAFFALDHNWRFTYVNPEAERVLQRSRGELLNKNVWDEFPEAADSTFYRMYCRAVADNVAVSFEEFYSPRGRWLEVRAYPSREGLSVYFRDITERKRAEEVRERLAAIVESSDDAILSKTLDGQITSWNAGAEKMYGYTEAEAVVSHVSLIVPPERADELGQILARVRQGQRVERLETVRLRKDGTSLEVSVSISPVKDALGCVVGASTIARDISERKRAERELRASEERYRELVENARDIIYSHDLEGKYTSVNKATEHILGYTREEALQMTQAQVIAPEDYAKAKQMLAQKLAGESETVYELEAIAKGGRRVAVEINTRLVYRDGQVVGVQGIARDVTERKRMADALREANQRALYEYERLLERIATLAQSLGTARDLVSIYRALRDFTLRSAPCDALMIMLYNAEREVRTLEYGWVDGREIGITEIPPLPVKDGPAGSTIKTQKVFITHDYRKATQGRFRYFLDPNDNRQIPNSMMAAPMTIMGRTLGLVEIQSYAPEAYKEEHATAMRMAANLAANAIENVRLLEREREQEEQLRQAQKMEAVGKLAGGVAHDFNNLLTAITGYSDLSLRKLDVGNPLHQHVLEIKRAADRAAGLTRQLLAFSRKQVLQPKVLDLNGVISEVEKMLRRLIGEDIELLTALAPALGKVKADPGQIEQVIMNLAVNARDAMPTGGKLTITTANVSLDEGYASCHVAVKPGHYVQLSVSDNGCGMSDETQRCIFEPFYTTKEVGKGTGLGLSTVYGIVKQSGGNIWVYSEPERGTTFKIYLPLVGGQAETVEHLTTPAESPRGTETVLLVEDDEQVRRIARTTLEMCGYKVLEAANGGDALVTSREHAGKIDLLLTDVVMPRMGGRELAEQLARLRGETRVLYMSGYTEDAIVHHGVIEEGTDFIEKPFAPAALARKVREVLMREVLVANG